MQIETDDFGTLFMLSLCVYREASNQTPAARRAIVRAIDNRKRRSPQNGWQNDYVKLVLAPFQFSSFNIAQPAHPAMRTDPNAVRWPSSHDAAFCACVLEVQAELDAIALGTPDPTNGGTFYYSLPVTAPPKEWGEVVCCETVDELHFWKPA